MSVYPYVTQTFLAIQKAKRSWDIPRYRYDLPTISGGVHSAFLAFLVAAFLGFVFAGLFLASGAALPFGVLEGFAADFAVGLKVLLGKD